MAIESSGISFGSGGPSTADSVGTIPFRMLVAADLSREGRGLGESGEVRTHRVDKDSFDALFSKLNSRLLFEIRNVVAGGNEPLVVDLEFRSMKDFEGPAIVAKVPALTALQKLREEIAAKASPSDTPASLADKISDLGINLPVTRDLVNAVLASSDSSPKSAPASGQPASTGGSGSSVDDILASMEEGTGEKNRASGAEAALGSAMSSLFKSSKSAATSKGVKSAIGAAHTWLDQRIGAQLDLILHHPDFQSMEEAWRGLRLLVERTDFRKEIVIEVVAARKQDLRRVLIEQVLQEEYDNPGNTPLGVVICDTPFDNSTPDIDLLNELAGKAELVQAPIVAQAGAEFFGRKSLQGLGGQGSLFTLFQGEAYVKWRALRAKEEARWVALTVNRFLLRQPNKGDDNGKSFPEATAEAKGDGLLWGNAVWALASCMTASYAREGWPHTLSGPRGGGAVENLPLRNIELRGGKVAQTPMEAAWLEAQVQDLSSAGLIPLIADEGSDTAYFTFLPVVFSPKKYADPRATQEAALHSILPYQLFAARISHWLGRLLPRLRGGTSAEELQEGLQRSLTSVLTGPGQASGARVRVEVSDHEKDPMRYQVCFEIHPAFKFFGMTPRLLLAVAVPR